MTKRARRAHSAAFKAEVAVAALKGEKTLAAMSVIFDVHANQIMAWKKKLVYGAAGLFETGAGTPDAAAQLETLQAGIGELTRENDFLTTRVRQGRRAERKAMIDPEHALSLTRQAGVLGLARSSVYYRPRPPSDESMTIIRRIGELHLSHPAAGSRRLCDLLRGEGMAIGRKRVSKIMAQLRIEATSQRRHPPASDPRRQEPA